MNDALISVVTVTYNNADNLDRTLASVFSQTYSSVESIVIDGGSSDHSQSIIEKYKSNIAYSISEPDKGIYDAMNKGIRKATGEWIIFMNAGDWFYDEKVLSKVFDLQYDNYDFIYGDNQFRYKGFTRIHRANEDLSILPRRNVFSHQALFSRTHLMKASPFNPKYEMVADFESFFKHYKEGYRFLYKKCCIIATFEAGGVSDIKGVQACTERWEIVKNYGYKELNFYYQYKRARLFLGEQFKSILPYSLVRFITQLKYWLTSR